MPILTAVAPPHRSRRRPQIRRCVVWSGPPSRKRAKELTFASRTASLIAALPLASPTHQHQARDTLALLAYALTNIARETEFFDSLPPRFLVDMEADPSPDERDVRFKTNLGSLQGKMMRPTTRAFVDLLISTGAEAGRIGGGMEEGLVLLWAMEKVSSQGVLLPSLQQMD